MFRYKKVDIRLPAMFNIRACALFCLNTAHSGHSLDDSDWSRPSRFVLASHRFLTKMKACKGEKIFNAMEMNI